MKTIFWNGLAILTLTLGVIGIVLPLLPTTPFVLLASACLMRGSPKWREWLLTHPYFGKTVVQWQKHRAISPKVKWRGNIAIMCSFAFSIWMIPHWIGQCVVFGCAIAVLIGFNCLKVLASVAPIPEN